LVPQKAEAADAIFPYAFTEQGVAMLSSVLHSPRAVHVNIEIMRAFVRLRQMLQQNTELARKLAALERKIRRSVQDGLRGHPRPDDPRAQGEAPHRLPQGGLVMTNLKGLGYGG
jgi:type II secretory pathway component PulJ